MSIGHESYVVSASTQLGLGWSGSWTRWAKVLGWLERLLGEVMPIHFGRKVGIRVGGGNR